MRPAIGSGRGKSGGVSRRSYGEEATPFLLDRAAYYKTGTGNALPKEGANDYDRD